MDEINWSNDRGDADRTEDPRVIAHVEARRMSVGAAYRSLEFIPDFVVLWQIRRRGTALALLTLYAAWFATIAGAAVTQNVVLVAGVLILLVVEVLASWFVLFSLEQWVDEYNLTVDDELRRVMGR